MQSILKYKKIIIAIIVIAAAFFVYSNYFKPTGGGLVEVESNNQAKRQFAAGKEILTLLVDLSSIQLNSDIFEDESFKSLNDFSLPIDLEPKGRVNPFAPIGVDLVETSGEQIE